MSTLVIENIPTPLFEEIQRRAEKEKCTAAEAAIELLQQGFRLTTPTRSEAPLPDEPFMTTEISAPFDFPQPEGKIIKPINVTPPLPTPEDFPELR
jgi:hypothetical protein